MTVGAGVRCAIRGDSDFIPRRRCGGGYPRCDSTAVSCHPSEWPAMRSLRGSAQAQESPYFIRANRGPTGPELRVGAQQEYNLHGLNSSERTPMEACVSAVYERISP